MVARVTRRFLRGFPDRIETTGQDSGKAIVPSVFDILRPGEAADIETAIVKVFHCCVHVDKVAPKSAPCSGRLVAGHSSLEKNDKLGRHYSFWSGICGQLGKSDRRYGKQRECDENKESAKSHGKKVEKGFLNRSA